MQASAGSSNEEKQLIRKVDDIRRSVFRTQSKKVRTSCVGIPALATGLRGDTLGTRASYSRMCKAHTIAVSRSKPERDLAVGQRLQGP